MKAGTVYIFVGPPGAGKGSLAQQIEKEFGFIQLSTGNLCRKMMASPSQLGKKVASFVQAGKLLPDELIIEMVQNWLNEHQVQTAGFIFDGFPRTIEQAKALAHLLSDHFPQLKPVVIHFIIDDETIIQRVASRIVCSNKECQRVYTASGDESAKPRFDAVCDRCGSALIRRADDHAATMVQRLRIYHETETMLLRWYQEHHIPIIDLSVDKPLADVFAEFSKQAGLASDRAKHTQTRSSVDDGLSIENQRKTGRIR